MPKPLRDTGIYCLGLTPYQYTVKLIVHPSVIALLLPEWPDNALIGGPTAYVTQDGNIGVKEGITAFNIADLLFTGRYKQP